MKKLKKIIGTVIVGTLAVLTPIFMATITVTPITLTGCAGLPNGTNNQAAIDAGALILQNTAQAGAVAAMTPPTGNTNNAAYFELAAQAIGTVLTGKDYSPAAFQKALIDIKIPQANNPWVLLGTGAVIDLYQVYFSQYVQGQVNGNAYAGEFLKAIQDGFNHALGHPVTTPVGLKLGPTPRPSILPRPMIR